MAAHRTGYFQFPLCLLGFRSDYRDRLQFIVSHCLGEHAPRLHRINANVPDETMLYEAAEFLNCSIGSPEVTIHNWETATQFIRQWQVRYGRDACVRIATA